MAGDNALPVPSNSKKRVTTTYHTDKDPLKLTEDSDVDEVVSGGSNGGSCNDEHTDMKIVPFLITKSFLIPQNDNFPLDHFDI